MGRSPKLLESHRSIGAGSLTQPVPGSRRRNESATINGMGTFRPGRTGKGARHGMRDIPHREDMDGYSEMKLAFFDFIHLTGSQCC